MLWYLLWLCILFGAVSIQLASCSVRKMIKEKDRQYHEQVARKVSYPVVKNEHLTFLTWSKQYSDCPQRFSLIVFFFYSFFIISVVNRRFFFTFFLYRWFSLKDKVVRWFKFTRWSMKRNLSTEDHVIERKWSEAPEGIITLLNTFRMKTACRLH